MGYVEIPEVIYINNWSYRLTGLLSSGPFAYVFSARGAKPEEYVIKIERPNIRPSQVENEWEIYEHLHDIPGIRPPTKIGEVNGLKFLLMKRAVQSLHTVFGRLHHRLPPHKSFEIAIALVNIVESMHSRGIVHRDIKPANVMVTGAGGFKLHLIDLARITLVDFGLSVLYKDLLPTAHGNGDRWKLTGTPLFASIHTHRGRQPQPRDDLESIAYVLVHLLRPGLPWESSGGDDPRTGWSIVGDKKNSISSVELASGLPGHVQEAEVVEYSRNLDLDQPLDYQYIRDLLTEAKQGIEPSESSVSNGSS